MVHLNGFIKAQIPNRIPVHLYLSRLQRTKFCGISISLSMSKRQQRYVLDRSKARDIYRLKFLANLSTSPKNSVGQAISSSALLAAQYGVASKTIRDIWHRKIWTQDTADLCDQEWANPLDRFLHDQVWIHCSVWIRKSIECRISDWTDERLAVPPEQSRSSQGIAGQDSESQAKPQADT